MKDLLRVQVDPGATVALVLFHALNSQQIQEKAAQFKTLTGHEPRIRIRGMFSGSAVLGNVAGIGKQVDLTQPPVRYWDVLQCGAVAVLVRVGPEDWKTESVIPERGDGVLIMFQFQAPGQGSEKEGG